jgi:hypothetical protein
MVVSKGLMTDGLSRPAACQCTTTATSPDGGCRADLAGDGHQDQVGPLAVICLGADDDRGAFLGGGLIGEGKRNDDDVSEAVGHGAIDFQMSL